MPVANGGALQAREVSGLGPEAAVLGEAYNMSTGEQLVLGSSEQAAESLQLKDESSEEFTPHKRYSSHPHNIEEAEDLLETYFMRVGVFLVHSGGCTAQAQQKSIRLPRQAWADRAVVPASCRY